MFSAQRLHTFSLLMNLVFFSPEESTVLKHWIDINALNIHTHTLAERWCTMLMIGHPKLNQNWESKIRFICRKNNHMHSSHAQTNCLSVDSTSTGYLLIRFGMINCTYHCMTPEFHQHSLSLWIKIGDWYLHLSSEIESHSSITRCAHRMLI